MSIRSLKPTPRTDSGDRLVVRLPVAMGRSRSESACSGVLPFVRTARDMAVLPFGILPTFYQGRVRRARVSSAQTFSTRIRDTGRPASSQEACHLPGSRSAGHSQSRPAAGQFRDVSPARDMMISGRSVAPPTHLR